MGVAIPSGSVFTAVIADAQTCGLSCPGGALSPLTASDVMSAVAAEIDAGPYGFSVLTSSTSGGLASAVSFGMIPETFQATFNCQANGPTDTDQIAAAFQQAFSDVTGFTVSQITVPSFTVAGQAQSTGLPGATPTTAQSIGNAISNFFGGLGSAAQTSLIVIVAIIVLVLVLIAYGPNVGGLAKAFA